MSAGPALHFAPPPARAGDLVVQPLMAFPMIIVNASRILIIRLYQNIITGPLLSPFKFVTQKFGLPTADRPKSIIVCFCGLPVALEILVALLVVGKLTLSHRSFL
jgi:hypothetical protein